MRTAVNGLSSHPVTNQIYFIHLWFKRIVRQNVTEIGFTSPNIIIITYTKMKMVGKSKETSSPKRKRKVIRIADRGRGDLEKKDQIK